MNYVDCKSINRRTDTDNIKHTHKHIMVYYSVTKKNEILSFAEKLMELEEIMLGEISQTQKDNYFMISLVCRI
jgi:hypothetical protein